MNRDRVYLSTLFIISFCPLLKADLSSSERKNLYDQANDAFRQALAQTDAKAAHEQFDKAILSYKRLIQEGGIHNAKLYYNLANAYLLNDNIGKAILNYRRAERLNRRDANIQKNLAFARSRRLDQVSLETRQKVLQTLFFWHYDFNIRTRFILACIFFAVTCISLTILLWRGRNSAVLVTTFIAALLTIALNISIALEQYQESRTQEGVIIAADIIARQGDSDTYPPSFKEPLHAGTEFDIREHRTGWFHIQLADGAEAWIPDDAGEII